MSVLWEGFDWVLPIFRKSYFKKWISGRHNWKISKTQRMQPALRRSFDSSAPELSSKYRVGGWYPARNVDFLGWQDAWLWAGWQIPKCTVQSVPAWYQDWIQKKSIFFIVTPCQIWDQIWKRLNILLSPMCLVFNNSKKPQSYGVL